jgi:uncharacterized protein (DUF2141 family)
MRIYNLVLWTALLFLPAKKGDFLLQVKNIDSASGVLRVAIYNGEQNFLKAGTELTGATKLVDAKKDLQIAIPDLPFGKYAIAIYHDVNNNGKLDKNYLGIPTEPYAFSNNPKVKWRSPTFAETQVELNSQQKDLHLELKRWKKY